MAIRNILGTATLVGGLCALHPAHAQPSGSTPPAADSGPVTSESNSELAKKLQNPIVNLISVPFQNNTNFNVGPHKGTQNILNIQPVIPIKLNEDWNVITRTILPLIWSPSNQPGQSVPFGLGPTTITAFLSPSQPVDGWIWGAGPVAQVPTITNQTLGSNVWGLGPAAVVVKLAGPIVAGGLINNVSSLGGTTGPAGTRYNMFTVNPFVNYNFWRGLVRWQRAGHHRELERAWGEMDIAGRRPGRSPDQDRGQTSGQPGDRCLLQRTAPRIRRNLANAHAGRFHFLTRSFGALAP